MRLAEATRGDGTHKALGSKWRRVLLPAILLACTVLVGGCASHRSWPAITASLHEERSCLDYHRVEIYTDGAVYYSHHEILLGPNRTRSESIVATKEYRIPRAKVRKLTKLIGGFDVRQLIIENCLGPCGPQRDHYETSRPEELAQFNRALVEAVPIEWDATEFPGASRCGDYLSRVRLRHDIAWKHGKERR